MKKLIILLVVIVASAFVLAGCKPQAADETKADDNMAADTMDDEQKTDDGTMTDDKMDKTDDSMEEDMSSNFLDVTLLDVDGNEWNLSKLDDKAVVKVWASWCSICLAQVWFSPVT